MLAVFRHPKPEWNFQSWNGLRNLAGDLAFPFEGDEFPSVGRTLGEIFRAQRGLHRFSDALEPGHVSLLAEL